jgi:hypothetical protein
VRLLRFFLAIAALGVGCATGSGSDTDDDDSSRSTANGTGGDTSAMGGTSSNGGSGNTGNTGNTGGTSTSSGPEGGSGNIGGMTTSSTTSTTTTTSNTTATVTTVTTTGGCMPVNVVGVGGFENGPFGGTWTETSTNFGTPVCDVASCGTGGGTGPASGIFWAWFGGYPNGTEIATASQSVTIPNGGMALLEFDFEIPVCDTPFDYFEVHMDGNPVFYDDGSSFLCGQIGYTHQIVDVTAYANGGAHNLEFYGYTEAFFFGPTNFMVDNVELNACL